MRTLFLTYLLFVVFFQTGCNKKNDNIQNNFEFIINGFAHEIYIKNKQYDFIDNPNFGAFNLDKENKEFNKCIIEFQIISNNKVIYTLGVFKIDQNYSTICNYSGDSNSSYCETIRVNGKELIVSFDAPPYFDLINKIKNNDSLLITAKYKLNNKILAENKIITQDSYELRKTDEKFYHVNSTFLYFSLPLNFPEIDKNFNVLNLKTTSNDEAYFSIQLDKDRFAMLHKIEDKGLKFSSKSELFYPKFEEDDMLNNGHKMKCLVKDEIYDSCMRMIQIKDRLYFYAYNNNHIAYPILSNSKKPITITFKKLNGGIVKFTLNYFRDK